MCKRCYFCHWLLLFFAVCVLSVAQAGIGQPSTRPILRIEPQLHFAAIRRMDVDAAERFVVTASHDKTARVWNVKTGELLQVLRPPIGDGDEGKLYAVAISPDGELVAVAGWTGAEWDNNTTSIYIFQRQTGQLRHRIQGLPNVILHLAFAADGHRLAVALGADEGIRVYERGTWDELARDSDYGADSYSIDFDSTGRLVSTSWDGYVRLYDRDFKLLQRYQTQGGKEPFLAKFSPDAQQIAVGFSDSTAVEVLDAKTLKLSYALDTQEIDNGNLSTVAWSQDGKRLYAGGLYDDVQGANPIVVWDKAGRGQRSVWQAGHNTLMSIEPLRDGGVLYASGDPSLGRLTAQGEKLWQQGAGTLVFTGNQEALNFALNATGELVNLHYRKVTPSGLTSADTVFNLSNLTLSSKTSAKVLKPRVEAKGLTITDWMDTREPKLNGQALPLDNYEASRSLAIDAKGKNFALGTVWWLRLYNAESELQWQQAVPIAWMVNISQDDRWVVAALDGGTVRWYEKSNGTERLAFYLHPDEKRWVAWTPEGFYATSSPDAESLIGYHINQGADREAKWVGVQQLRQVFARADLVSKALDDDYAALAAKALQEAGSIEAILAKGLPPALTVDGKLTYTLKQRDFTLKLLAKDQGGGIGRVEYRLNGALVGEAQTKPFGARLPAGQQPQLLLERPFTLDNGEHTVTAVAYNKDNQIASDPVTVKVTVEDEIQREPSLYILSIGVTDYRDPSLVLKYAANDAKQFAEQWSTQKKLFKVVEPKVLIDQQVTVDGVSEAFKDIAAKIQPQDVFILYLAGHGKSENGRYYFAPQDFIYENQSSFEKYALGEDRLRELLATIPASKRWMILDTCYSGKAVDLLAQARGIENKAAIDRLMQSTGTSVIAAASSTQEAMEGVIEDGEGHGLLTYTLLKGLKGEADMVKDKAISVEELQSYARKHVPLVSKERWQYEQFPMMQLIGSDFPVMEVRH